MLNVGQAYGVVSRYCGTLWQVLLTGTPTPVYGCLEKLCYVA